MRKILLTKISHPFCVHFVDDADSRPNVGCPKSLKRRYEKYVTETSIELICDPGLDARSADNSSLQDEVPNLRSLNATINPFSKSRFGKLPSGRLSCMIVTSAAVKAVAPGNSTN